MLRKFARNVKIAFGTVREILMGSTMIFVKYYLFFEKDNALEILSEYFFYSM